MVDWKTLKKIDAHIHILPDEVHEANPDSEDAWLHTDLHQYVSMMEKRNIEKAVIMPLNDPWLMSMAFTVEAVHRNLRDMKTAYPGKFYAFADVDYRNTPEASVAVIARSGLDGIKLHPNNAGVRLDSKYNAPIFAYAQEKNVPVAVHCYPNSEEDFCTAGQILRILERFPELKMIVCHMAAHQWEQLISANVFLDISAILPEYVRAYGIRKTNEILRSFGPDRLLFASDYPDSRLLTPGEIYETYFDILNRMDFTREEAEKIAFMNLERILAKDTL